MRCEFRWPGRRIDGLRRSSIKNLIIDPAIKYVMPECFGRASILLDSRLRGNDVKELAEEEW